MLSLLLAVALSQPASLPDSITPGMRDTANMLIQKWQVASMSAQGMTMPPAPEGKALTVEFTQNGIFLMSQQVGPTEYWTLVDGHIQLMRKKGTDYTDDGIIRIEKITATALILHMPMGTEEMKMQCKRVAKE